MSFTTGGRSDEQPAQPATNGCAATCQVCGVAFGRVYRPRLLTLTIDGEPYVVATVCGRHQDAALGALLAALAPEPPTPAPSRADQF